jgi:hypothetical protein
MNFFSSGIESLAETVGLKEETSEEEEQDEENQGNSLVPKVVTKEERKDEEVFITDMVSSFKNASDVA